MLPIALLDANDNPFVVIEPSRHGRILYFTIRWGAARKTIVLDEGSMVALRALIEKSLPKETD